uniref:Ras family protein n=1 Tax=Musca domestica TaxID=7370 RepID=A0A1I8NK09_MUSDO
MLPIKCVILGNGNVGKTTLIHTYLNGRYSQTPLFSCGHYLTKAQCATGEFLDLLVCDTKGTKEFDRINRLSYRNTDVFVICFSVDRPDDLCYVHLKWLPEIRVHCPGPVPIILVATKVDMRNIIQETPRRWCITKEQGRRMAKVIKATYYIECSANDDKCFGVSDVFSAAVTCGLEYRSFEDTKRKRKSFCSIL